MIELRVFESHAGEFFEPSEGKRLGSNWVRRVLLKRDDERVPAIARRQMELAAEGQMLYGGWSVHRSYSAREIEEAGIFQLDATRVVETTGEAHGTVYDDSAACSICGSGGRQVGSLVLDTGRLPRGRDIVRTIGGEYVIAEETALALYDARVTGCVLRPVHYGARPDDDPIDLRLTDAGRALLVEARQKGLAHDSLEFYWWISRAENRPMLALASDQPKSTAPLRTSRARVRSRLWFQLTVEEAEDEVDPQTWVGSNPLDRDAPNPDACPLGHLLGTGQISQLYIARRLRERPDFSETRQFVGVRRGFLRPRRLLLVSPRVRQILADKKLVRGASFDVVRPAVGLGSSGS